MEKLIYNKKGSAYMMVIYMMIFLTLLATALFSLALHNRKITKTNEYNTQNYYLSESASQVLGIELERLYAEIINTLTISPALISELNGSVYASQNEALNALNESFINEFKTTFKNNFSSRINQTTLNNNSTYIKSTIPEIEFNLIEASNITNDENNGFYIVKIIVQAKYKEQYKKNLMAYMVSIPSFEFNNISVTKDKNSYVLNTNNTTIKNVYMAQVQVISQKEL